MKSNEMTQFGYKAEEDCLKLKEKAKTSEMGIIIREYKEQNNIECITEEEFTYIFGESVLFPNLYLPLWGRGYNDCILLTDYEEHLLHKGENIVEPSPASEWQKQLIEETLNDMQDLDTCDLGDADTIDEGNLENELSLELEEYSESQRPKRERKVEIYCDDDMPLLRDMLYNGMGDIDLQYTYYFEEFIIIQTYEDGVIFRVYLSELDENCERRLLGSGTDPEKVQHIMMYWREFGDAYDREFINNRNSINEYENE